MARRSKFTPELGELILRHIRLGNSISWAAKAAGVHRATFYAWIERGKKASKGQFKDFADQVEKAEAEWRAMHLNAIATAALSDPQRSWRASAWLLETRYPEEFGRRVIENIGKRDESPVQVIFAPTPDGGSALANSPEGRRAEREQLLARLDELDALDSKAEDADDKAETDQED